MTLIAILLGTLAAGIGSVWLAAALSFGVLARYTQHMLSLAAGALLGTAFLHLLPEAFESAVEPHTLFLTLLVGVLFFFLLDKAELWHHGHEHHQHEGEHGHAAQAHDHHHGHAHAPAAGRTAGGWAVLAHEVPHHMGDLMVLRLSSGTRQAALLKVTLAGAITALGGLVGYWLVDLLRDYLTYFLVVASSSFVYVALADLIPQLQKRLSLSETVAQIAWLLAGIALVTLASTVTHSH